MHWINLTGNILVVLGAGSLFLVLVRWQPEAADNPLLRQISNRAVYLWAYTSFFVGLMALIGAYDSYQRLRGKPKNRKRRQAGWLRLIILLFPLLLWAAEAWKYSIILPDWIFSIIIFLGVLIPAIWLLRVASGELWGQHKGRDASVISFSSTVTLPIIILVESFLVLIIILALGIFGTSALTQIPETMGEIERMLDSPLVLLVIAFFIAGIAPVVEELLKTLSTWFLVGLNISDGEGYMNGLMGGSTFAIMEGMLYASQTAMTPGNDWLGFLIGRLGGTLIHIFNGGLIGWAIAKTWRDRNVSRLASVYLLAFFIHAIWNLAAYLTQILPTLRGLEMNQVFSIMIMAVIALLISIGFITFARFILRNEKIRHTALTGETHVNS
ncbi:MAG: PrsW family glutamic-type intramembrane protease [Anaerolineaceae bacterium]|jgi:RsiW-degrading membrane proteinase PrsW (M82 family)|nr:PrsW family glutamic-type intramembrane protease [Anaerolineaceae bacterium]MDD4042558.1 PrsW family glutamic-type intramembrane protease [Anaerolineaceae bacterium]MDD4578337.1 PrsW family glutamic-type intramembrane protease [Anaerolineaceae bacterium]